MSKASPRFTSVVMELSFWVGGDLVGAMEAAAEYAKTVKFPASAVGVRSEESDAEGFEAILSLSLLVPVQILDNEGNVLWCPWQPKKTI